MKTFIAMMLWSLSCVAVAAATLPKDIKWETNTEDEQWADLEAQKGGTYRTWVNSYPLTFRTVGPDSNGAFRSFILDHAWSLVGTHPNTANIIPELATHWAFAPDNKSMYFKLNPKAKWSDGKPLTAKDFVFSLEFMRSKNIVAPWYNNHYTEFYDKIVVFDDHTLQVLLSKEMPKDDLYFYTSIRPVPSHFYNNTIGEDFVKKYNWEVEPVTGPYIVDAKSVKKGKSITLKKVKDWWAAKEHYVIGRYNVDKIRIKVVRDQNVAWEQFKKGQLDRFAAASPEIWHEKAIGKEFDNGYIKKLWFYTDGPEVPRGMYLNTAKPLLKDINIRNAIAHATNADRVIEKVLRNDYTRLAHANVGYGEYTKPGITAREFNIKKSTEYLAQSGFNKRGGDGIFVNAKGQRVALDLTYLSDIDTPRLVVIKEEMKKAGIELNLKLMDSATGFKSILEKQHDIAWMGWSTNLRPTFWQGYHSDNANKPQTNNITNTSDKKLDAVIESYRNAITREDRIKLAHQAQQMIHDLGVFIPTFQASYYRDIYWAYWKLPKVPGAKLYDSSFSPGTGIFWLDKDAQKKLEEAEDNNKKFGESVIINKKYKR